MSRPVAREYVQEGSGEPRGDTHGIEWPEVYCELCHDAYGFNPGCDGCKLCRRVWSAEDQQKAEVVDKLKQQLEEMAEEQGKTIEELKDELKGSGNKAAMSI